MKTIKVIDLLNKIANGEEVPEHIKYLGIDFSFQHNCAEYINDYGTCLIRNISSKSLNDEVEIIEEPRNIEICGSLFTKSEYDELAKSKEDKKIEKLNCKYTSDVSKLKVANKVDEIIELLNNSMLLSEKEVGKFLDKVNGEDNENRNV